MSRPKTFKERLEDLAPELYEMVYDFTFTTSTSAAIRIDSAYQPPSVMQVSQKRREAVRHSYYANNTFTGKFSDILRWVSHLDEEDRAAVSSVRCWFQGDLIRSGPVHPIEGMRILAGLTAHLEHAGLREGVVKLREFEFQVMKDLEEEKRSPMEGNKVLEA